MSTHKEKVELLERVFGGYPKIPEGRRFFGWHYGWQKYRGRDCYVVGYSWSRMYSHHMSGKVYDAVLGRGGDFDAALADAAKRLTPPKAN